MRGNRFGYYIREGIGSIFTHGFMSFASVCIIVACLLIMGSFTLLALNVDSVIDTMESQNAILAFVNEDFSEEQARAIQPALEALDNVETVYFVNKDTAWDSYVDTYENPSFFEGLDSSFIRHRFVIYIKDIALMAETRDAVCNVAGIADVNAQLEISRGFVTLRNIVTFVSLIIVAILFAISLFIMSNTVKLTTYERKDEIAIMKMVGATSAFIRWPFVVQGLILGLMGSLTSYLLEWGIYQVVTTKVVSSSGLNFLTTIPFSVVAIPILVAFLVVGLGVGIVGSLVAIKNYLKV